MFIYTYIYIYTHTYMFIYIYIYIYISVGQRQVTVAIKCTVLISVVSVDGRELSTTFFNGCGPHGGHPVQQHHGGLQQLPATRGGAKSPKFRGQSAQ